MLCTTVFRAGVLSGCGAGPAIAVANARIRDSRHPDARARHRRQRRDFHRRQRRPAARAAVPRHRSGGPRLQLEQDRDQGQPLGRGVSRSRRAQPFPRSAGGLSPGSRRGDRWRSVARPARGRVRHARVLRGRRHAGGTGTAALVRCAHGQAGRPQPRRLARPVSRRLVGDWRHRSRQRRPVHRRRRDGGGLPLARRRARLGAVGEERPAVADRQRRRCRASRRAVLRGRGAAAA